MRPAVTCRAPPSLRETVRAEAAAGPFQRDRFGAEVATVNRGHHRRLVQAGAGTDDVRPEADNRSRGSAPAPG